jgi:aminopeptidase N
MTISKIRFSKYNTRVNGLVKITFKALQGGDRIILDTNELNIIGVMNTVGRKIKFEIGEKSALGSALTIPLGYDFEPEDIITVMIKYQTTEKSFAAQWLSKEQTMGKEYPYMYTQCGSIYCRSLLPCQDTPSIKITIKAAITVPKPLYGLFAGNLIEIEDNDNTRIFRYQQDIPIPTYLIAFAAGNIASKQISQRSTIYTEPEMLEQGFSEFKDIDLLIQSAEKYLTPYEWKEYNLLILPPSFPYGGMENPTLTFVTPSLLAGDKSLVNVVAHEISHSWFGNLITPSNWQNFWVKEGFTVFLERKIGNDVEMAKLEAQVGKSEWDSSVLNYGIESNYTSLHPDVGNVRSFYTKFNSETQMMLFQLFLMKKGLISFGTWNHFLENTSSSKF